MKKSRGISGPSLEERSIALVSKSEPSLNPYVLSDAYRETFAASLYMMQMGSNRGRRHENSNAMLK